MSEYGKIETLYERDKATFKVKPGELKSRTYGLLKRWHFTEKIDGMNMRAIWQPGEDYNDAGCSPYEPIPTVSTIKFRGRTDNAMIPGDLLERMQTLFPITKLKEMFGDRPVVFYGEGYGAGIQKGADLSATKNFILFDVLIHGKVWLNYGGITDIAQGLGVDVVPDYGFMTLEEATESVRAGFQSKLNGGKAKAEGLIGRPEETLFDHRGSRLILKLKTKDF